MGAVLEVAGGEVKAGVEVEAEEDEGPEEWEATGPGRVLRAIAYAPSVVRSCLTR